MPSDPRALLQTPRTLDIYDINYGKYWHYGLKKGVTNILNGIEQVETEQIEIVIGIDDLPISKSSGSQMWPILGRIFGSNKVFIIGIYHGGQENQKMQSSFLIILLKRQRILLKMV